MEASYERTSYGPNIVEQMMAKQKLKVGDLVEWLGEDGPYDPCGLGIILKTYNTEIGDWYDVWWSGWNKIWEQLPDNLKKLNK